MYPTHKLMILMSHMKI